MASAFPEDSDEPMETVEKTPAETIKDFDPNVNDRIIGEKLNHILLEIKTTPQEDNRYSDGYTYCWLIVQSAKSSTDKNRFRVKITWTGTLVKKEIERLYDIPPHYQTLLINGKVVSDAQTLETFDVKSTGQIIYCILTKKKLRNAGSRIRVSDFVPPRAEREAAGAAGGTEQAMETETDGSSDTTETAGETSAPAKVTPTSSGRRNKKKKKSRRPKW